MTDKEKDRLINKVSKLIIRYLKHIHYLRTAKTIDADRVIAAYYQRLELNAVLNELVKIKPEYINYRNL